MDYYQKYLKYKNKYTQLKENLKGGTNHPACKVIPSSVHFPTMLLTDKTGFHYFDSKYNPNDKTYTGKWCSNPNKLYVLQEYIIVNKQIVNNYVDLMKFCQCD